MQKLAATQYFISIKIYLVCLLTNIVSLIFSSYDRSFDRCQEQESQEASSYGYNYNNYRPPPSKSLKGKMESKYWHTKQSVIQKLGKDQDTFVVAGDAEVDARLEVLLYWNL